MLAKIAYRRARNWHYFVHKSGIADEIANRLNARGGEFASPRSERHDGQGRMLSPLGHET